MSGSALPPMRVPTLTEVVEWSELVVVEFPQPQRAPQADHLPVLSEAVLPEDVPMADQVAEAELASLPTPASAASEPIDEAVLTQRILSDLQSQVDLMLEARLQAAMTPLLERLTQTLAQEARDELALTLRNLVAEAVSQELTRHGSHSGSAEPV